MIVIDKPAHLMRIECDGKKTPLGCMVAESLIGDTREECNQQLYLQGWRLHSMNRTLCRVCSTREQAEKAARAHKAIAPGGKPINKERE